MNTHNLDKIAIECLQEMIKENDFFELVAPEGSTESDRPAIEYIAGRITEMLSNAAAEEERKHSETELKRNLYQTRLIALLRGLGCTDIYDERLLEAMYEGCL